MKLQGWQCSGWLLIVAALLPAAAIAQSEEFTLSDDREWSLTDAPEPGTDEARIAEARKYLADGRASRARQILAKFIEENESLKENPWLPAAYRLRGDALVALGHEYRALYDYEEVAIEYPGSEEFRIAVEREVDIAKQYIGGLKVRFLGIRIADGGEIAVELLIRAQERLPGSDVGEDAMITLANYYFDRNKMALASEAYDLYLINYPNGPNHIEARRLRIFAEVLGFKGPEYSTTGMINARIQTRDFIRRFGEEMHDETINEEFLEQIDESLAARQLKSAEWYMGQRDSVSARFTLERLIADYPDSAAAARAREIMEARNWEPVVGVGSAPIEEEEDSEDS